MYKKLLDGDDSSRCEYLGLLRNDLSHQVRTLFRRASPTSQVLPRSAKGLGPLFRLFGSEYRKVLDKSMVLHIQIGFFTLTGWATQRAVRETQANSWLPSIHFAWNSRRLRKLSAHYCMPRQAGWAPELRQLVPSYARLCHTRHLRRGGHRWAEVRVRL